MVGRGMEQNSSLDPSANDGRIVEVAVFAPVRRTFDYLLPSKSSSADDVVGRRALVPFGRSTRVGIVLRRKSSSVLQSNRLKDISKFLDSTPILSSQSLELVHWASLYYHHPIGEVAASMLPTRMRRRNGSSVKKSKVWRLTQTGSEIVSETDNRAHRQKQLLVLLGQGSCTQESFSELDFEWRPVLRRLLAKRWVEEVEDRLETVFSVEESSSSSILLNDEQRGAVHQIATHLGEFAAIVVHGVTGSGKTEVYLQVVESCLNRGKQSLLLVPEIGLTRQLVNRFRERFGSRVGVMHSGLRESERLATWERCTRGELGLLVGTRSAVWTPLPELALIIVDEEHDQSYKQQDGFRYSARDIATVRAQLDGIPVVLGSATPSLETLANVRRGKYLYTRITSRPRNISMPRVTLIDVRGIPLTSGLSSELVDAIKASLDRKGQVMLFLNRRGYSPLLICRGCGEPQRCDRCDSYLVYHKAPETVRCHHCDKKWTAIRLPSCCSDPSPTHIGLGTERIEESIRELFPKKSVRRIDRDSVRRKGYFDGVLTEVAEGRVDILIGTQMLAKGFDFSNVALVGVVDTDSRLYSVDFRAEERLAQLLIQVAGRAGRASSTGRVLVQTHQPHHPVLRQIIEHGYDGYAEKALRQREEAGLPPYSAMTILRADSRQPTEALKFLGLVRNVLNSPVQEDFEVSYPIPAFMERRAGKYRALIVIRANSRVRSGQLLETHLSRIDAIARRSHVRWSLDVDPQDTL